MIVAFEVNGLDFIVVKINDKTSLQFCSESRDSDSYTLLGGGTETIIQEVDAWIDCAKYTIWLYTATPNNMSKLRPSWSVTTAKTINNDLSQVIIMTQRMTHLYKNNNDPWHKK